MSQDEKKSTGASRPVNNSGYDAVRNGTYRPTSSSSYRTPGSTSRTSSSGTSRTPSSSTSRTPSSSTSRTSSSGTSRTSSSGSSRTGSGTSRTPGSTQRTGTSRTTRGAKKRRRGLGMQGAVLYVVLVLGVSALLAGIGWRLAGDVLALNKEPLEATVTLPEEYFNFSEKKNDAGKTVTVTEAKTAKVASLLKEEGLIESRFAFKLFSSLTHGANKIVPGTYTLDTDMDYRALISNMSARSAARATVDVTIPEGFTALQIFERLEENGVCTVEELKEIAANYDFKFSFLKDVIPLGDYRRLEGYLFPDTYTFYRGDEPVNVLNKMILRFDEKFTDEMRAKVEEKGMTIRELVTVASLIEKETTGDDQTSISAVIYNRLKSNSYRLLQIDATVQYILPERKENLSTADLQIDDPYNTYVYPGLPAGPIANPGESAIRAAMNPEKGSKNYFYALGDDGEHHFFQTYDAHRQFISTQQRYKNG